MKRLILSLFSFGLMSTCALAAELVKIEEAKIFREALQSPQIENLPIPESPFSLTFKNDQITIYKDEEIFNSYDTKTPRLYVDDKPLIEKWQLTNVLFEAPSQTIYVHAHLPMYDRPLVRITKNSATELFDGGRYTIWRIFMGPDDYVHVSRSKWASNENSETFRIIPEDNATS